MQELKSKRSHRRRHSKAIAENRDDNSRNSANSATGKTGSEGPGNSSCQRKHNKGSSKQQHFIQKERLFYGNYKAHGGSRNSNRMVAESPPSNAVGFFFGSTPPDSHGSVSHLFIFNSSFFSNIFNKIRRVFVPSEASEFHRNESFFASVLFVKICVSSSP